jgi:hypothetical protein
MANIEENYSDIVVPFYDSYFSSSSFRSLFSFEYMLSSKQRTFVHNFRTYIYIHIEPVRLNNCLFRHTNTYKYLLIERTIKKKKTLLD